MKKAGVRCFCIAFLLTSCFFLTKSNWVEATTPVLQKVEFLGFSKDGSLVAYRIHGDFERIVVGNVRGKELESFAIVPASEDRPHSDPWSEWEELSEQERNEHMKTAKAEATAFITERGISLQNCRQLVRGEKGNYPMGNLGNVYLIEEDNGDIYKVYIKLNNTGKSKQF